MFGDLRSGPAYSTDSCQITKIKLWWACSELKLVTTYQPATAS